MRYPKASLEKVERGVAPIELGQAEVYEWGSDGMIMAFGSLFPTCVKAAEKLRKEGLEIGVINARFAKPLDKATILAGRRGIAAGRHGGGRDPGRRLRQRRPGSRQQRRPRYPPHLVRLGIPDRFVEHGERAELLADLGLDVDGICRAIRQGLETEGGNQVHSVSNDSGTGFKPSEQSMGDSIAPHWPYGIRSVWAMRLPYRSLPCCSGSRLSALRSSCPCSLRADDDADQKVPAPHRGHAQVAGPGNRRQGHSRPVLGPGRRSRLGLGAKATAFRIPTRKTAATADTVYRVGSVSKPFTALLLMMLVEQGAHRPRCAGAELPARLPAQEHDRQADHAAANAGPSLRPGPRVAGRQLLRRLRADPGRDRRQPQPDRAGLRPETTTSYSNAALATVGFLLEKTQKEPFAKLMQRKLLEPLGMTSSTLRADAGSPGKTWPRR